MKSYKYKVEYKTVCAPSKEVKFLSFDELQSFLGQIILVVDNVVVYQKIKGTWELIRVIDSKICYGL